MNFLLSLLVLPLIVGATPVVTPVPAEPVEKRDYFCTLYPGVKSANCRYGPSTTVEVKKVLSPAAYDLECYIPDGQSVSGNSKWDYVSGLGCWISATVTMSGCESGLDICYWYYY